MKTIRMRRADWEKWDTALRSGEYKQAPETLCNDDGGYCCLGVLEMALEGEVEREPPQPGCSPETQPALDLPSDAWLDAHGIRFIGDGGMGGRNNPYLPKLGTSAADANDQLEDSCVDFATHRFDFVAIADAIADAVEFTD